MVFLAAPIPRPAARKAANFPGSVPWFLADVELRGLDAFVVFLGRPPAVPRPEFLPTFQPAAAPVPRISANFSADLQGALTANLENLKSRVVWSEKTLCFRGESLEVGNG